MTAPTLAPPGAAPPRFEAVTTSAASSEVAHQLIRLVTSGGLVAGARLPPERHLQQQLGVGRSAIREALAALALLGLIEIRPGSGSYLRDSTSSLLPAALSWGMMLNAAHTEELIDLRSTLEVRATALAATHMTDSDVEDLRQQLGRMQVASELPGFVEADAEFHRLIAERSGNSVLSDLLGSVHSLLRVWMERAASTTEQAAAAYAEHALVFDALAARDPERAQVAMSQHMRTAAERVGNRPHA